jgi:hypothetical protein
VRHEKTAYRYIYVECALYLNTVQERRKVILHPRDEQYRSRDLKILNAKYFGFLGEH